MDYSNSGSTNNLQSQNRMLAENVHHISENSIERGVLSPAIYSQYDEKQAYQYQNPPSCLNQLLQNNQYGPYSNLPLRPFTSTNYHGNFRNYDTNWNLSRSQSESARMYYSQYHETYSQNPNNVTYSKVDKIKSTDYKMTSDFQANVKQKFDNRNYPTNPNDNKAKLNLPDWKFKTEMVNILDGNDIESMNKIDTEIKPDKLNSTESIELKSDSSINSNFHLNTSTDLSDKSDVNNTPNYVYENKINQQSQMKQQQQVSQPLGYDNSNYNQMMMQHPNPSYYSQFRYTNQPSSNNNTHNYINQNNNTMMSGNITRSPMVNYPNYNQTSSPGPGYGGYPPPVLMHQNRPFNVHSPFVPRGTPQSSFSSNSDIYMNGSIPPRHQSSGRVLKDPSERKGNCNSRQQITVTTFLQQEEANISQDTSSVGSNSNKSVNARSSSVSKLKTTQKNESHPPTPVSNTIPSPSQTSMSSMIDENEDSVSSLGPSESNIMNHISISNPPHLNQYPVTPQMSQTHSMVYPQPYSSNQAPHTMINSFPTHLPPQPPKPFSSNPNTIHNRQYHHNESQANNNCFQKLMELGNEQDREPWIERYLRFMEENNTPLSAVPTVVKQPLDLFRLYHAVRERGGLLNVVKTKRWKEICLIVNVNASASGAYTLRRNYIKCLLDYECKFDRNGIDPGPILQEIQSLSDKKKKSTSRNAGSSPTSTISSHHNSEYSSTSSTPRLPHPDFNSPNPFHGHTHTYHNAIHNGPIIHRGSVHYPSQRSHNPFPGPYTGPRMMSFNSSVQNPMHPHARYETNMPQNWNKSLAMNQQQWPPNPGSSSTSSSSCSTHPSQRPISPGTPTNNISIASQQSQPTADSFDMSSKDVSKSESSLGRCTNSEKSSKKSDNLTVGKEADKIEMTTKTDYTTSYYNNAYIEYPGQELPCDYKNMAAQNNNSQYYPPVQYPSCFSYSRQHSSSFRQPGHNSISFPSYYPPTPNYIYPSSGALSHNNSHHVNNNGISPHSTSQFYSMGNNIQEHSRRIDWKSNYGGMPPPPPPPPNIQPSNRPNLPNISQIGAANHSTMPHCNYSNQAPNSFHQQRTSNPPLSSNFVSLNRNSLQSPNVNLCDQININSKSSGSPSSSSIQNQNHNMQTTTCHSRSHIETSRLNPMYAPPISYSKCSLKRFDCLFPPDSVEATQPDYSRKRKYLSKDIKAFNPNTVTMALKSGLVAEVSWALNYLNIWTKDDVFFEKLNLKNLMPMFQSLVDIWRNSLGSIFGRNLFIDDLELPVLLNESTVNKTEIKTNLFKIESVLKSFQLKQDYEVMVSKNNVVTKTEDNFSFAQDKVIDLLHGVKYSMNRLGLAVKLDLNSKLEYALEGDVDLTDFIIKMCCNSSCSISNSNYNSNCFENNKSLSKSKIITNLSSLLDLGGSDSTYHILPPLLSQNKKTNDEWYLQLDDFFDISLSHAEQNTDNSFNGPPEIKRSRCISPHSSSTSSNPPNLEHENHVTHFKSEQTAEDIDHFRLVAKSEMISDSETLFFKIEESDEEKMLRCICVSNAIRNLSFLNGNDRIIGSNRTTLVILGRLLLLGHEHGADQWPSLNLNRDYWWLKWIDDIREHVFVTLVNISSYLELSKYHDIIVSPIINGLLHWLTCNSAAAEDSLSNHRFLGCRRLALESIMRLCVHEKNIDFILTSNKGSDSVIRELFNYLASSFCYSDIQVVKEMSLAVMHYLSMGGENGIGCIYLASAQPNVINGLINFIEITESQIRQVVDNMGMEALQARPELMGTSLEFLRQSGALLNRIASYEVNRKHFNRDHEIRMLNLVISTVLDQTVAQSISGVLHLLSNQDEKQNNQEMKSKCKSFLTFNDLSFCEKDSAVSLTQENETSYLTNCAK